MHKPLLKRLCTHSIEFVKARASSFSKSCIRGCPYLFSFALMVFLLCTALCTAMCISLAPSNALASSEAVSETNSTRVSDNQSYTYNYQFKDFIDDVQLYPLFAGNVGNATQYITFTTFTTAGSASVNNNIFYVNDGAGIDTSNVHATAQISYKVEGAAGHIALNDNVSTATATGNTSIMDASFDEDANKGYIASLTGAYININSFTFTIDDTYIKTTVDTVTASDNSVILKDGTVGIGREIDKDDNTTLNYDSGSFLTGAFVESKNVNSSAQFNLYNNSVLIEGGSVLNNIGKSLENGAIAGAFVIAVTGDANMSENSVTITGGDVQADQIMGAGFYSVEFTKTKILGTLSSAASAKDLYIIGGFENNNSSATLFNNSVTISDTGYDFSSVRITGAYSEATNTSTLYNNSVTISGGNFVSNKDANDNMNPLQILGAYINPKRWQEVDVEAGVSNGVTQGDYLTPDSTTVNMQAYNNSVTITGGTIYGTVSGAAIKIEALSGASLTKIGEELTYNGTLSNNTVTIYGGTIANRDDAYDGEDYNGIYGGLYQGVDQSNSDNSKRVIHNYSITNNTVNIGFSADLGDKINIGGGAYNSSQTTDFDYFTLTPNVNTYNGNTLNINRLANTQKISTIANFENINFLFGAVNTTKQMANTALLALNDTLYLGNGYATAEATATAYDEGNGDISATTATKFATLTINSTLANTIADGDTIKLLSANEISGSFANLDANNEGTITGTKGVFLTQTWDIENINNTLTATLKETKAGEQAKVFGEVGLGGVVSLNSSSDLLTGKGIPSAQESVKNKQAQAQAQGTASNTTVAAFAVTSAGTSRYNTGSHVDVNSFNLSAGLAYGGQVKHGDWLVGAFIEYGYGDYSTYNSFSNASTMKGDGTTESVGGGIFSRFDFTSGAIFRPYVEGSLRMGSLRNEYSTDDVSDVEGLVSGMHYDMNNTYLGAHFAVGNVYAITDRLSLDTSLTYYWTRQNSMSLTIVGHEVDYDSIDSNRLRAYARAHYIMLERENFTISTYGGLGYEHEFNGDAITYVDGYKSPAPSLQGGTGIGELGFGFKSHESPFAVNLGVQGYVGKREGVGATLDFVLSF